MTAATPTSAPSIPAPSTTPLTVSAGGAERPVIIALMGNPNTGKTTLFNRISGLRHKTSNFPGTTLEARVARVKAGVEGGRDGDLVDLPGIYSIEIDQLESRICREVLAGQIAPRGEPLGVPEVVCVVVDATNLARNLMLVGEVIRRRLPMVVAVNMTDLAAKRGGAVDGAKLSEALGCPVAPCSARTGEGIDAVRIGIRNAKIASPALPVPGDADALRQWAEEIFGSAVPRNTGAGAAASGDRPARSFTDRADRVLLHPVLGAAVFALVMTGLFWSIFSVAQFPMGWIESFFAWATSLTERVLPEGVIRELMANGVVAGVGSTVIFLPQICLLFFLISLLEDTGYLARAAFVMDRVLRPFGLPGHAFVPLLSSHACALPGIMACRAIPDRRERLATILVAPFMSCSARIPVYVLLATLLFAGSPMKQALAFVGCYALGIVAGVLSALIARRTILRGPARPMALELPSFKAPSLRTALVTTLDRGLVFLKKAGTNILMICIVLWWLGAFPHVKPPIEAVQLREQAAAAIAAEPDSPHGGELLAEADRLEARHASANSFLGMLGRSAQPVFAPLGYDRQLTIGVLASFAAREVFVSTMAVVVAGTDDTEDEGVISSITSAKRDDGVTLVFTPAVCWSLLVYYVLAMQCLPTLAVTAREAGGTKWALLQLGWMSVLAYAGAFIVYQVLA